MSSVLSLYPVLTGDLFDKIGFAEGDAKFSFHDDAGVECDLTKVPLNSSDIFKLEGDDWDFDIHDLVLRQSFHIESPSWLFGKDGVACQNAKIGVAVEWMSPTSRQRGTFCAGESLEYGENSIDLNVKCEFEKAQLRGQVEFRFILFVKDVGVPALGERHLANQYGLVLGELGGFAIELDGNGSEFPICRVHNPGQPLWYLKCEWIDPLSDAFNECVTIYLNDANPNYKYLDKKSPTYDPHLIAEIVAHAMTVVVIKLKEVPDHWLAVENETMSQIGSVCKAVNYLLSLEDIDKSSIETISLTLRKYLEKKV